MCASYGHQLKYLANLSKNKPDINPVANRYKQELSLRLCRFARPQIHCVSPVITRNDHHIAKGIQYPGPY